MNNKKSKSVCFLLIIRHTFNEVAWSISYHQSKDNFYILTKKTSFFIHNLDKVRSTYYARYEMRNYRSLYIPTHI